MVGYRIKTGAGVWARTGVTSSPLIRAPRPIRMSLPSKRWLSSNIPGIGHNPGKKERVMVVAGGRGQPPPASLEYKKKKPQKKKWSPTNARPAGRTLLFFFFFFFFPSPPNTAQPPSPLPPHLF